MKTSNIVKFMSLLLLLIALLTCASKQQAILDEPSVAFEPKLLFLNFKITQLNDQKEISLINQITTDGKLKRKATDLDNTNIGDLECAVLDKNLNTLETYFIKNPLKKTVEFINDSGSFEKKTLNLDSSQFSIRLQREPKAKYIVINERTKTALKKHISTEIE